MEIWMFVVGAVLAFGAARVVYADFVSEDARVTRWLARRPRVRIGDAKGGLVRLTGKVRLLDEMLRAPITNRPCAAYRVLIDMPDGDGAWKRVLVLIDARPFALIDESGEAIVDTAAGRFTLVLQPDRRGSSRFRGRDTDELRAARSLLEAARISTTDWLGGSRTLRFSEAILTERRKVSVGGQVTVEVMPDGDQRGYRTPPERVVVRASADDPLRISNWRAAHGPREP